MLALGQDEIAKYPFLADAGKYLKDQGFSLEQFGSDPDLKQLIEKAYDRILVAADGKIYKSDLDGDHVSKEAALPREVFFISFGYCFVEIKRDAYSDQKICPSRSKKSRKIFGKRSCKYIR